MAISVVFICLLASAAPAWAGVVSIYVLPMSHLDIGFTAPPSAVSKKMCEATEKALEQAAADPAYVWDFETFWQLEQWLESKPPAAKVSQLIHLIKTGRFGLGAAYATPHTCVMSAWALDWLFRLPTEWAKEHGLRLEAAVLDDVPGHCGDLPHFMAKNGVQYLVIGANLSFSPPLPDKISNTPFWWETPSGERVLTWISAHAYTDAYIETGFDPDSARFFNKKKFGDPDPMKVMEKGIRATLKNYEDKGYPYDAILALHAFDNWGAGASVKVARFAKMWNEAHTTPKIIPSAPQAFFEHIKAKYGRNLPVYRGGFGGQWDTNRACIPTAMRIARQAEEIIQSAKKPDLADVRRLLVFYEHSFGMGPGWPNIMTRELCLQHNREQLDLLLSLPRGRELLDSAMRASEALAQRAERDAAGTPTSLSSDHLYWLPANPMFVPPKQEEALKPLPAQALLSQEVEDMGQGGRRLCYVVDRRKLPDPASVVWLRELTGAQANAKIRNRTATGLETLPDDQLAGYSWGAWVSPLGFQLGDRELKGDGILAFRRQTLGSRAWLIGLCLGQRLSTTFKPGVKGELTFEEAYPCEPPIAEISIEIFPARRGEKP
jgi:hypothetical protein